ncbi:MAG TPA: AlkA N-terminal domain-containing protein [Dehalococcoidia bacterium]|nr:AlkA N-terminal domain-containing protein [Dehalococcoidia bacterium]
MGCAARPLRLSPRQPYAFDHALTYFNRRAGELVDRADLGCYRRLFALPDGLLLAELRPGEAGSLVLTVRGVAGGHQPCEADVQAVAATLTRTLGLEDDLADFRDAAAGDAALAGLVRRFAGLRLISTPAPFEAFVWAVLGQQISLHVAFRLKAALVQRCGAPAEIDGTVFWAFPTARVLAAQNPDELAALGLGRRKAATIVHVAGLVAGGALKLERLAALPLDEAERELTALHGVGPWTARYTLLRGLRLADACPVSDGGLMAACGSLYDLGRKATSAEVEAFSERWRPYRGYAAYYLWFMLARMGRGDG